ncbi:hypothetical protein [Citrobacter sp. Igbk 14]|uniref:hypothetical protein n=1 Tax=Citrobacter sp. Igbk 14 TaxID=2963960 RepID=UPI002303FB6E|nr:hypothetical protein [Citrobacter sp. Igbk 14]MDA8513619.1 hypothetical protein [Citrobacter sp. Igbk 14]
MNPETALLGAINDQHNDEPNTPDFTAHYVSAHNVLDCEMAWNTLFPLKTHNQMAAPISDKLEA